MFEKRLKELSKLEVNWDSYDAVPITASAIDTATKLLTSLDPTDGGIFPMPGGGIQIEWINSKHITSIEVSPDSKIFSLLDLDTESRKYEELDTPDIEEAKAFLNRSLNK